MMTEAEFIAIAKRPPSELERRMNGIPDSHAQLSAPGSWPWPMSQEARKWVESACIAPGSEVTITNGFTWLSERGIVEPTAVPEPEFNRAGHDEFMKGLR